MYRDGDKRASDAKWDSMPKLNRWELVLHTRGGATVKRQVISSFLPELPETVTYGGKTYVLDNSVEHNGVIIGGYFESSNIRIQTVEEVEGAFGLNPHGITMRTRQVGFGRWVR